MSEIESRRRFLKLALAAGAVPGTLATFGTAAAADLPHLDENDATAKALGYLADTTKVDAKKYPNHKADQTCANCNLAQGAATDAWRPCSIFPGKAVNAKGWCAAWVKKA